MSTAHSPATAAALPAAAASFTREREPLPIGRTLRAYLVEAGFETLSMLRTPAFGLPMVVIPIAIYLLFGVVIIGDAAGESELGPGIANYLFSGFAAVGTIMAGVFGGSTLAADRDANLVMLKRALPQPPGAVIVAKVLMTIGVTFAAVTLVVLAALAAGKITISLGQVLIIWATLVVGAIPFCAIGLLIGTFGTGSAAAAYGNLVVLPQMWLAGLFIPLPDFLQRWVIIWPAFHVNQLALGLAGVEQFTFVPPTMAAAVLAGFTVLCGGLAIRRLARIG